MKKLLYLVLLLLFVILPIDVYAAGSITTSVTSLTVEKGETKTFEVVFDNAVGIGTVTSNNTGVATVDKSSVKSGSVEAGETIRIPVIVTGASVGTTKIVVKVTDGALFTVPSTDMAGTEAVVTVNVVEPEVITYTVTYDANEGSVTPTNETVNQGETVTLPTPIRSGYKFLGWYNSKTNGTKVADAGVSYKPTASVTLYAQWEEDVVKPEVITYTVTYDLNEGTNGPSNQTKIKDEALTLSSKIPTRDKYEFVSWNTKKDGSGTSYLAGSKYTSNANMTLYAQWKSVESVDKNPQTGDSTIYIILAIIITFGGYTYWYTKKVNEN